MDAPEEKHYETEHDDEYDNRPSSEEGAPVEEEAPVEEKLNQSDHSGQMELAADNASEVSGQMMMAADDESEIVQPDAP